MLIEMTGVRFRGLVGEQIQIVAQSIGNGGVEEVEFEYDGAEPDDKPFDTSPGCEIIVLPGNKQFQAVVHFNSGVAGAQYELSQVDENGELVPLDQSVDSDAPDPLIGFTITGVAGMAKAAKKAVKGAKATKAAKTAKAAKAAKTAKTVKKAPRKTKKTAPKKAKKAKSKKAKAGQS